MKGKVDNYLNNLINFEKADLNNADAIVKGANMIVEAILMISVYEVA